MGYSPGTIFEIIPRSASKTITNTPVTTPAFVCCISSDKGPEKFQAVIGEDFYKQYGSNLSFEKHGQPLLQAANIIDAGGIVLVKRVVAEDSALANLVLWGVLKTGKVQKTNAKGELLYTDANTGEETTSATSVTPGAGDQPGKTVNNEPIMITQNTVSYETTSYANVSDIAQVKAMTEDIAVNACKKIIVNDANKSTLTDAPVALANAACITELTKVFGNVNAYANKNVVAVKYANNTLTLATMKEPIPYTTAAKGFPDDTKSGNFVAFRITLPADRSTEGVEISMNGVTNGPWGPEVLTENKYLDLLINIAKIDSSVITFKWANGETTTYTVDYRAIAKTKADGTVTTPAEVEVGADDTYVQKFPIYAFTDVGRGLSNKRIRIYADNRTSKGLAYMLYNLQVLEGTTTLETLEFCSDYTVIRKSENMSVQTVTSTYSQQIKSYIFTKYQDKFIEAVAASVGVTGETIGNLDYLFGTDRTGKYSLDYTLTKAGLKDESTSLVYDLESGINMSYAFGQNLENGSNGAFGTAPWGTDAYNQAVLDFWTDKDGSGVIFDVDGIKPCAIIDANYPLEIKNAIGRVVKFREDCFYFRDLGLGLKTIDDISWAELDNDAEGVNTDIGLDEKDSMFCASYHNSYDVIDPHTKRQIPVTISYTLSKLLPSHFINGAYRPVCGQLYHMVINDAVEGTINYIPRKKPGNDEKEALDDLRINYIGDEDGTYVLESDWTATTNTATEFQYVHNVLAVQMVIRAVRRRCPKIRYSFLTAEDLTKYKNDVQTVLDQFGGIFETLEFEYIEDKTMVQNKVFYAAIKVKFKNFIRSEYFKIYELENDGTIN